MFNRLLGYVHARVLFPRTLCLIQTINNKVKYVPSLKMCFCLHKFKIDAALEKKSFPATNKDVGIHIKSSGRKNLA